MAINNVNGPNSINKNLSVSGIRPSVPSVKPQVSEAVNPQPERGDGINIKSGFQAPAAPAVKKSKGPFIKSPFEEAPAIERDNPEILNTPKSLPSKIAPVAMELGGFKIAGVSESQVAQSTSAPSTQLSQAKVSTNGLGTLTIISVGGKELASASPFAKPAQVMTGQEANSKPYEATAMSATNGLGSTEFQSVGGYLYR